MPRKSGTFGADLRTVLPVYLDAAYYHVLLDLQPHSFARIRFFADVQAAAIQLAGLGYPLFLFEHNLYQARTENAFGQLYLTAIFVDSHSGLEFKNLHGKLHQCVLCVIIVWKCLKLRAE